MIPLTWPCPLAGGGIAKEYAIAFDQGRKRRLLIVPALFEEANRMRRMTLETMRRLDGAGIDSFLPDLPGCNESLQPLWLQEPQDWSDAMAAAAWHFGATHALGIRGGCLFTPRGLPAWHYASTKGTALLRQMMRARILASREAGREETRKELMETALREGIELAGYRLGAEFVRQFEQLVPSQDPRVGRIAQDTIGGGGLWLRAEPGESRAQADALAALVAVATAP